MGLSVNVDNEGNVRPNSIVASSHGMVVHVSFGRKAKSSDEACPLPLKPAPGAPTSGPSRSAPDERDADGGRPRQWTPVCIRTGSGASQQAPTFGCETLTPPHHQIYIRPLSRVVKLMVHASSRVWGFGNIKAKLPTWPFHPMPNVIVRPIRITANWTPATTTTVPGGTWLQDSRDYCERAVKDGRRKILR